MPTEFVAQNGAVIHETTKIAVTGCTKEQRQKEPKQQEETKRSRPKRQALR